MLDAIPVPLSKPPPGEDDWRLNVTRRRTLQRTWLPILYPADPYGRASLKRTRRDSSCAAVHCFDVSICRGTNQVGHSRPRVTIHPRTQHDLIVTVLPPTISTALPDIDVVTNDRDTCIGPATVRTVREIPPRLDGT